MQKGADETSRRPPRVPRRSDAQSHRQHHGPCQRSRASRSWLTATIQSQTVTPSPSGPAISPTRARHVTVGSVVLDTVMV